MSNFISSGCSFTFGNELSDDFESRYPSKKSWAYKIFEDSRKNWELEYTEKKSLTSENSFLLNLTKINKINKKINKNN